MAIDKVAEPNPTAPLTLANAYQAQNLKMTALSQAFTGRNPVDGSTLHAGTVMMIGSVLYKVTTDTTITGTPSLYVKITPSVDGLTATASFVDNLTGVSWNHAYGGYYDGSVNLYLFDEALAYATGVIASYYTMGARLIHGNQIIEDTIPVSRMVPNAKVSWSNNGTVSGTEVLPNIEIGEMAFAWYLSSGGTDTFQLPATGTYNWTVILQSFSGATPALGVAGGSTFGIAPGGSIAFAVVYSRTA